MSCPSDIYEISDVPKAMTWTEPTFSDNVKVTKVEQTFNSGDKFPIGPTKVKYDASDAAGNRISCEFTVTLKRKFCMVCSSLFFNPIHMDGGKPSESAIDYAFKL